MWPTKSESPEHANARGFLSTTIYKEITMPRIIIACLAALFSGCASDQWTRTDTIYELAYVASISADAYTTSQIQYTDGYSEQQPATRAILGAQPRTSDTWSYFATLGVSHYLISRALPERWRRWWQVGGTAYHGYMAYRNCENGLCSKPSQAPCSHSVWTSDSDVWVCLD
jgi:hypothetical protein